MSKVYNQAPLPFMGQKRKFLKEFKTRLDKYPADGIFIDLFGGSGLLSRAVKDTLPKATVIYNDFDNYQERINAIPETNEILRGIRLIVNGLPKDKRIPSEQRREIIELIRSRTNFVDYITISSSLLFSMKYAKGIEELEKETFYNCVRDKEYNATGYLDGLTLVKMDYKALFQQYKLVNNAVFLVDPPYLSTEAGTYNGYWKLRDYLDVLTVINHHSYFYFTSNKSNIVELCEWMASKTNYNNPFANAKISRTDMTMNYNSSYTDFMIFKSPTVG